MPVPVKFLPGHYVVDGVIIEVPMTWANLRGNKGHAAFDTVANQFRNTVHTEVLSYKANAYDAPGLHFLVLSKMVIRNPKTRQVGTGPTRTAVFFFSSKMCSLSRL
jgi:hypothetical protein